MAWSTVSSLCLAPYISSSSSSSSLCFSQGHSHSHSSCTRTTFKHSFSFPSANEKKLATLPLSFPSLSTKGLITRASEYKFPDPIPEFADAEAEKFRNHLHEKLSKRDIYGESVEQVVGVCTEIFSTFLDSEYGGPGTLMVVPFIDMADTVNERGLPGGPQAARAAIKWAQNHVDKDWKEWTGGDSNK